MGNCHRGSLLLLRALGQPSWRKAVLLQITGHPDGCRCTDLASDSPLPEVLIWQAWSSHLGSARPSLHYPFILISCSSQDLWSAGWRPRRAGGVAPMSQHSGGRLPLQFSSVQSLSHVQLFATPWTAARQASLSITNSRSLLKLMSIVSLMPSNHLMLCQPLLPPSVFPSIRVFSNESVLHIRWPKY